MEMWKIHKFCETASLAELRERQQQLREALEAGRLANTNAQIALNILTEYIELKEMLGEK